MSKTEIKIEDLCDQHEETVSYVAQGHGHDPADVLAKINEDPFHDVDTEDLGEPEEVWGYFQYDPDNEEHVPFKRVERGHPEAEPFTFVPVIERVGEPKE